MQRRTRLYYKLELQKKILHQHNSLHLSSSHNKQHHHLRSVSPFYPLTIPKGFDFSKDKKKKIGWVEIIESMKLKLKN